MLIGIDASRALRARRTGTERYALEIICHLLALPEATQHQWRLYVDGSVDPDSPLYALGQMSQVELCLLPARRLWTHRALASTVIQHKPDVLFVPAHVLPFVLPASRLPPSVVTIHDLGHRYFPEAHTHFQRLYLELSTRWAARQATRLIAISQTTANDLNRFYGAPAEKIQVIYEATAAPGPVSRSQQAAVAQRYALTRPYALYLGTIQPRKNLARLIQAYARLHAQQPLPWDLVLAGNPGWLSDPLYALVAEQGLSERVRFIGYVAETELPALYQGAHFFCFPSLFEGFGLPILEAQSYGVPVMSANNSSLPEVAGDAAILVDPTDVEAIAEAMLRLSQDEALRQQLIAKGHENVKRFSWVTAARETLAVLIAAASKTVRQ
jgi:glycosyltransferase involved in cell wall biosynthesis